MAKVLVMLSIALQLALASGPCSSVDDNCGDDSSDQQCSATCAGCVCCPHARTIAVPALRATLAVIALPLCVAPAVAVPPSPEPEDISHVPKPQLA